MSDRRRRQRVISPEEPPEHAQIWSLDGELCGWPMVTDPRYECGCTDTEIRLDCLAHNPRVKS